MGMGYQGFCRFYNAGPATTPLVMLTTAASVNMVLEPIFSTTVWGAGWYNAATSAHYADNAIRFEGNLDFELQGSANVWDLMEKWLISERAYPRSLDISPDGSRIYRYRTTGAYGANYDTNGAWNTTAGFSTSADSFVTVSAGMVALDRASTDGADAGATAFSDYSYIDVKEGIIADACSDITATNPLNPSGNNVDPIPYWRTQAELLTGTYSSPFTGGSSPQAGLETVEWSVDLTQNHIVLYTCNGSRLPTALLMGAIDVTGNLVLFHADGVFDPILGPAHTGSLTAPYLYAETTWFRVTIARGSDPDVYIELPAVVVESDDYSIPGQSDIVNRGFGIKGLGGRCNSAVTMPPMIMSDSSGAFVSP